MNSTEDHKGAAPPSYSADLISAECVPRVYPYADDISALDAIGIDRIECFIDNFGVAEGFWRGTRKYIQPARRNHGSAEGDMTWVYQVDFHRPGIRLETSVELSLHLLATERTSSNPPQHPRAGLPRNLQPSINPQDAVELASATVILITRSLAAQTAAYPGLDIMHWLKLYRARNPPVRSVLLTCLIKTAQGVFACRGG
jgi:hypothetical protein